jgi:predicted nucleic acid-binding protein
MAVLVDTGPLLAIIDKSDESHIACVKELSKMKDDLFTVWPVVTELMHLLNNIPMGQEAAWALIRREISLIEQSDKDVPRIQELMMKYGDLPMDLADAAIVRAAEEKNIRTIFTTDKRDFSIYRPKHTAIFKIIPRSHK